MDLIIYLHLITKMETFARSLAKGALVAGAGLLCFASGGAAAPLVGAALVGSGAYSGAKATIRGVRELADESDGEMYFVYYDLDNAAIAGINYILPEFIDTDLIASATNKKIAHCKAWFTTSSNSYVTFELTAGKHSGVIASKHDKINGSALASSSTVLQLVRLNCSGSLGGDNKKIDWRKRYSKRKRSI